MKIIKDPSKESWPELLQRPMQDYEAVEDTVRDIFRQVCNEGDDAVFRFTRDFDGADLQDSLLSESEISKALPRVPTPLKKAIEKARENIEKFHRAQRTGKIAIETSKGVSCWQEKKPIDKVGLYIPGGSAPLFSTVLMLAVPATIAGCREVVLCSPPDKKGELHPAIIYAATLCGIRQIYKVGGIQAIAAMTFGTERIPGVYKIFGPGNQYVTVAKQFATRYGVAIDMPAGPSELLVVADETADPEFVASDLLSQAEHGPDSQVILVTTSELFIDKVEQELTSQLGKLPRRDIASKAMANSRLVWVKDHRTATDMINAYGPEHLIICSKDESYYLNNIRNAGSVFVGNFTPESAGDYASGTNHTLPTNGYARQYSGVNLDSFLKSITYQRISEEGMAQLGPTIEIMAEAEGLFAHKNAVSLRLRKIGAAPKSCL
jgi:histidinol dehydrogenase